jgi:hypothetical protein
MGINLCQIAKVKGTCDRRGCSWQDNIKTFVNYRCILHKTHNVLAA